MESVHQSMRIFEDLIYDSFQVNGSLFFNRDLVKHYKRIGNHLLPKGFNKNDIIIKSKGIHPIIGTRPIEIEMGECISVLTGSYALDKNIFTTEEYAHLFLKIAILIDSITEEEIEAHHRRHADSMRRLFEASAKRFAEYRNVKNGED